MTHLIGAGIGKTDDDIRIFTQTTYGPMGWFWWLVRKILKWDVNHAGLAIYEDGEWWVYEAFASGIRRWRLEEKKRAKRALLYWFRFEWPLSNEEATNIWLLANERVGTPYAFFALLSALRFWLWQRAHPEVSHLLCPFYHCSGFVADVCRDAYRPLGPTDAVYFSPQMVHRSKELEFMGAEWTFAER